MVQERPQGNGMANWILMFRPETYAIVKEKATIGVLYQHRRRFAELQPGDRFVAYVSKSMTLDAHGTIAGAPFEDAEPLFGTRERYPERCKVAFEETGIAAPGADPLWHLSVWPEQLKTTPWNMLFCYGGFMKIPDADYDALRAAMTAHRAAS